jgi:diguanylate cyclase (GGDEF)-like protein
MRIALAGVSLTVMVLFYLAVYRPTRSKFSGWWTVSLLCAGASTSLLMLNGSDLQVVANPASSALATAGVTCVWFATRSLRRQRYPMWLLGVAPAAILVLAFLENPAENIWAGNGPLFVYMGVVFAAGSIEVWLAWAARRARLDEELNGEVVVSLMVSALASSVLAAFYLFRSVIYFVSGPESVIFESFVGTGPTTGILLVCLVAVTFSVSAVGWDQQTQELRQRAILEDLTGLLGRTEFRLRAERALAGSQSNGVAMLLVIADLDHFKAVNDAHGHAAGDQVLVAFAAAVKDTLLPGEFAGRLGGEEFGVVLLDVDDIAAIARLESMSAAFAARSRGFAFAMPTVSYGMAGLDDGDTVAEIFERADLALYRAKADGRDRSVKYTWDVGREAGSAIGRRAPDQAEAQSEAPRWRGTSAATRAKATTPDAPE